MKQQTYNSSQYRRLAALIAVDALFFGLTDPANVPSFALIIGFLLFALTLYQLVKGLFKLSAWYGLPFSKRQLRTARILTGVIAGLIALQSMGQLGGKDLFVLIPLAFVAHLYLSYSHQVPETATLRD